MLMPRPTTAIRVAAVVVVVAALFVAPAVADSHDEDDDEDGPAIDINLDGVIDEIDDLADAFTDFSDDWDNTLEEILLAVIFAPFRTLAQALVKAVAYVLLNTPTVHPNPAVEAVHRDTLLVTYLLSTLAFAGTGILYMTGPLFGLSYTEVRVIIPRVVCALGFATVSPILLQYAVDLSDALVVAFQPPRLSMTITQMAGLSTSLVLVWVINASLLLVLVLIFILRGVYLMFVTAISPLIALAWAFPKTKRYADTFIAGWWTAWAMAPLDMLVLRFNLELMAGTAGFSAQTLSNWMFGVAGFALLILVPYQLYGASQAVIGQAYALAGGVKQHSAPARRKLKNRVRARMDRNTESNWTRIPRGRRHTGQNSRARHQSRQRYRGDD